LKSFDLIDWSQGRVTEEQCPSACFSERHRTVEVWTMSETGLVEGIHRLIDDVGKCKR